MQQHTYQIGSEVYTLHITRGPIFHGTEERSGEARWNDRVLLISPNVRPEKRKEVLVHEAIEAWNFHFPKPEDKEKLCDWQANVHVQIAKDFERNGGQAALDALEPTYDVASPPGVLSAEREQQLRQYRFPELSDENYSLARSLAESRGLHVWSEQFHVKTFHDHRNKRPSFKIVMNIEGLRLRAHRTRTYAGIDETLFTYGDHESRPVRAVVHVYRLINGERFRFTGEALWSEYYGGRSDEALDDVVKQFPSVCLARCAEAAALRRAFTEETQDIHVPEEFAGQLRRAAKPMPRSAPFEAGAPASDEPDLGEIPHSSNGLHMRLMEMGYKVEAARKKLIAQSALTFGSRNDGDEVKFYRHVILTAVKAVGSTQPNPDLSNAGRAEHDDQPEDGERQPGWGDAEEQPDADQRDQEA